MWQVPTRGGTTMPASTMEPDVHELSAEADSFDVDAGSLLAQLNGRSLDEELQGGGRNVDLAAELGGTDLAAEFGGTDLAAELGGADLGTDLRGSDLASELGDAAPIELPVIDTGRPVAPRTGPSITPPAKFPQQPTSTQRLASPPPSDQMLGACDMLCLDMDDEATASAARAFCTRLARTALDPLPDQASSIAELYALDAELGVTLAHVQDQAHERAIVLADLSRQARQLTALVHQRRDELARYDVYDAPVHETCRAAQAACTELAAQYTQACAAQEAAVLSRLATPPAVL